MDPRPSAEIIAFPSIVRPPAAPIAPAPDHPSERLQRALAALEAAVAAQHTAVAAWRRSLGALRGSMHGLGESLHLYHAQLGQLGAQVGAVNAQARRLEAWADAALDSSPQGPPPQGSMKPPSSALGTAVSTYPSVPPARTSRAAASNPPIAAR